MPVLAVNNESQREEAGDYRSRPRWSAGKVGGCCRGRTTGPQMRYKVGAEHLEQVPSLAHRPDGVFRAARAAPVGPTHAVDAATGVVACGIKADGLEVLDQDREEAFFVEKCPGYSTAVVAQI
jgi:hypothetical protein